MKVVAIMQNQWLKNAAVHQRSQDAMRIANPEQWWKLRRRIIAYALFAGCQSGKVLKRHLGELTECIEWEEASTIIGGAPDACPPADIKHIQAVLDRYEPSIVIAFGRVAKEAACHVILRGSREIHYIPAPHPAARRLEDHAALEAACQHLREAITLARIIP